MSCIRPTKFAHVVYRTRRFEQMLHWYETVFDARVQYQNPALAFLTYDDEHHRFAFANMSLIQPDATDTDRHGVIGVDHVAYTHASLNDLLENYAQLKEKGISPYWCIHHGITVSMYYADPDGNQMEFQVDSYRSSEDANAFINANFSANPVGVEYDPEDWLARLRAGASVSDFLVRQVHEPVSPLRGSIARSVAATPR
ncbi:MAG TPA: VOC family protein [Casimicrobiaceae bacterium]|jgi:catechol-2,3-dioxygenase